MSLIIRSLVVVAIAANADGREDHGGGGQYACPGLVVSEYRSHGIQYLADRHDAFVLIAEHLVARAPLQDLEHADETPAEEVAKVVRLQDQAFDCQDRDGWQNRPQERVAARPYRHHHEV